MPQARTIRADDFYLGDGLYAAYDGFQIKVYATDGGRITDQVFFEPAVLAVFLGYVSRKCPTLAKAMGKL